MFFVDGVYWLDDFVEKCQLLGQRYLTHVFTSQMAGQYLSEGWVM